jgi:hypothetical protein
MKTEFKDCWLVLPSRRIGFGDLAVENGVIAAIEE